MKNSTISPKEKIFLFIFGTLISWSVPAFIYCLNATIIKDSVLHNPPEVERKILFIYLPLLAMTWPVWMWVCNRMRGK